MFVQNRSVGIIKPVPVFAAPLSNIYRKSQNATAHDDKRGNVPLNEVCNFYDRLSVVRYASNRRRRLQAAKNNNRKVGVRISWAPLEARAKTAGSRRGRGRST